MNSRRAIVALLVVLVAGAVGVAFLMQSPGESTDKQQSPKDEAATAAKPQPASQPPAPAEPAETPAAALELHLYGAVIDAVSGAAIKDATIFLQKRDRRDWEGDDDKGRVETKSDEVGAYALDPTEGEFKAVVCTAKGYRRFEHPLEETAGKVRVDFQLQPGGMISGVVQDEANGKPIEGAMIRVVSAQQNFMEMMMERGRGGDRGLAAKSGVDGTYALDGVPVGSFRVMVSARRMGYVVKEGDERRMEIEAGKAYEHVDFRLSLGGTVSGIVVDASGKPVRDAHVSVMPTQFFQTAMRTLNSMNVDAFEGMDDSTDDQGKFEIIGLEFGAEYRARADADGYAGGSSDAFKAEKGGPALEVTVTLLKGSTVSGVTKFASGEVAPNEMLMLFPVSREAWSQFQPLKEATSSEKGEFRFENVSAGEYLIRPMGHGMPMGPNFREGATPVTVETDKDAANIEVVIEKGKDDKQGAGVINGTVTTADGKPAADVRVEARDSMMPMATGGATSEADGTFSITGLSSQTYDVSVEDEKGIAEQKNVAVGSSVALKLQPPALIAGTVVTASGDPVASCSVSLKNLDEEVKPSPENMPAIMRDMFGGNQGGASTDAYGHFEFKKVKAGKYTITAKSQSSGTAESEEVSVDAGEKVEDLRLVLDPGVSVAGVVVGPDGKPVAGAALQLVPVGSDQMTEMMSSLMPAGMVKTAGSATSGPTGEFTMSRVPAGPYRLVGTHGSYARTSTTVTVNKGVDVTGLRLALQKPGGARGKYLVNGKPQPNVMVMVMGPNGFQMTQTDSQGQFDVTGLSSGSYMVTAVDPSSFAGGGEGGIQFKPRVIDVAEGQVADIDMGVGVGAGAATVAVSGTITGTSGGSTTIVALRRPGGPSMENINVFNLNDMIESLRYLETQAIVGSDGTFSLEGVDPGEYVLEVYSMDPRSAGPDITGMMNSMHSPAFRETITVGEDSAPLNINIPSQP